MSGWVRLWHDMPTDPKWRVIARKSGQRVGDVIAVFTFLMVSASANANERGRTHGVVCEDIAAALDLPDDAISSILTAMTGKVLDGDGYLTGWEKRQPKREDSSAERAKRWRDERKRTQANASERPEIDIDADIDKRVTNVTLVREKPESRFDDFWSAYPLKKSKQAARVAYMKALKKTDHGTLVAAVDAQRHWPNWVEGFIPHPATWLNAERWSDEREPDKLSRPVAGQHAGTNGRGAPDMAEIARRRAEARSADNLSGDGWLSTGVDGVFVRGNDPGH